MVMRQAAWRRGSLQYCERELDGDVDFSLFGKMIGGYGEEVREASQIQPALLRAREAIAKTGKCAVVNVWVDPNEYAPGTKAQTMYK